MDHGMDENASAGAPGALDGIRVLDLTRVLAGPLAAQMLGDLGADVIKVEPPGAGDDTRTWGPPWVARPGAAPGDAEAAYYLGANRNKRSITLDLGKPAGRELLGRLIERADIVIDNYKQGTLARWGFDDAWFDEHAPRAIRASVTGYGPGGPKSALPGYDFIAQAESGLMSICGDVDGEPMKYGVAIVDIATGLITANGILAALAARTRTGRGQKVEASLYETGLFLLANVAMNHLASGRDARRFGNGHPNIVPYTTYPAADAMIAVAVGNDAQFAKFAELIGEPGWANDPQFATNAERIANRERLDSSIGLRTREHPADAWIAALRGAGIPCARINTVAQALADEQTAARGMVVGMSHEGYGDFRTLGCPVKLSDTPAKYRLAPPRLGEHGEAILRAELGLSDAQIDRLREQHVLGG
jgi:crotonobetainyl-CoA:carnitine CoA-transferase CaiB-like acyl-CoA transferase